MTETATADPKRPGFSFSATRNFRGWMVETGSALAFTTYQGGALVVLGVTSDGHLERAVYPFDRCMGLGVGPGALWVASRHQIWRFSDNLAASERDAGIGASFRPRVAYVTGDIDVHEIAIGADGRPIFANTLFSCLASVSDTASFEPVWRPGWITRLAAEDRCHLNGLALRDGRPGYVTALAQTDTAEGWRDHRRGGGIIVDVASGELVATGLSMPHSPRWHMGRLYVLNSGLGAFGQIDLATGQFTEIAAFSGYPRGLDFIGRFAVIGLSKPREGAFQGLALQDRLKAAGTQARCGIRVVDLDSGDVVHGLDVGTPIAELFDVRIFNGVSRVALAGGASTQRSKLIATG